MYLHLLKFCIFYRYSYVNAADSLLNPMLDSRAILVIIDVLLHFMFDFDKMNIHLSRTGTNERCHSEIHVCKYLVDFISVSLYHACCLSFWSVRCIFVLVN